MVDVSTTYSILKEEIEMKKFGVEEVEYSMEDVEQALRMLDDEDLNKVAEFEYFTEVADMALDILIERHDEYIGEFNEGMKGLYTDMVKVAQEKRLERFTL